jgi:ABC-type nitrate/sulfonate/bicarbonate transport system ATPase subunit
MSAYAGTRRLSGKVVIDGRLCLALARALAVNAAVLLLDKLFATLDMFMLGRRQGEMVRVCQWEKKVLLFITPSIEEAIQIVDRIVVMTSRLGRLSEGPRIADSCLREVDSDECVAIARHVHESFANWPDSMPGNGCGPV